MSSVSEGNANFLHGLSDLWVKFFKEKDQLQDMYKGSELLVGQAYLDLMGDVLATSLREVPVFRRELIKLITLREDQVYLRDLDNKPTFDVTDIGLQGAPFLFNRIFSPTTLLESGVDFHVDTDRTVDELVFETNPFDWDGSGGLIPGVAARTVGVEQDDGSTVDYRELAFWAPDAQVEQFDMYLNFGYLLGRFEPSGESYRALLQGISRYFVLGPTIQSLTSALNVIVGLPVVRDDGEVLTSVDTTTDIENNIVITSRARYSIPNEFPLREDVVDESNWGTLTFESFDHLAAFFTVKDHIADPRWWVDAVIPSAILPDESNARRFVGPDMYENILDNPPGLVHVGDPGFFIGADDDGYVPWVNPANPALGLSRPTYRHLFSYVAFERFLRHHAFIVEFDHDAVLSGAIPFQRFDSDIQSIIKAGRSAYTYLFLEPGLDFQDVFYIQEETVTIDPGVGPETEEIECWDNTWVIGATATQVGDYYTYAVAGINIFNESVTPIGTPYASGKTPVVVSGPDPRDFPTDADGTSEMNDWPVEITVA